MLTRRPLCPGTSENARTRPYRPENPRHPAEGRPPVHDRARPARGPVGHALQPNACAAWKRERVITGYHARVDPRALGRPLLVFVELKLAAKSNDAFERVKKELAFVPEVMECHLGVRRLRLPDQGAASPRWATTGGCSATSCSSCRRRPSRAATW